MVTICNTTECSRKPIRRLSDGQNEAREFAALFGLPEMVLPERHARVVLNLVRCWRSWLQIRDKDGGVEVLAELRDVIIV